MTQNIKKTGVILLNWNTPEYTIDCIRSLQQGSVQPWRIVVFDNASKDNSPERILQACPNIELQRSELNLGFAAANNRAADYLLKEGADYLWILNNDTRVASQCLEELLNAMERDPTVAAASGKIRFMDPPDVIQFAGAFFSRGLLRAPFRGLRERDIGQYDIPCDVDCLSGCCMFVRAEVWRKVGGFRENYFSFNEDTEWCVRARKNGLRLRYVPQAVIQHALHASTGTSARSSSRKRASPKTEYLQTRNSMFLIREHARRPWQFLWCMADNFRRRLYRAAGLTLVGRWQSAIAIMRGLLDGIRQPYR